MNGCVGAAILFAVGIVIRFAAFAQSPPAELRFEVASVRPTLSQTEWNQQVVAPAARSGQMPPSPLMHVVGLHVDTPGLPMRALLSTAYRIDARLIVAPDWVNDGEARFAIHATMPAGATEEQYPDMLRALLEERFRLVAHRAAVEQTAYALVVGKSGLRLKKPGELDRSSCPEWSDGLGGYQICRSQKVVGDHTVNIRMMTDSAFGPFYEEYGSDGTHDEYFRITMPLLVEHLQGMISPAGSFGPASAPFIAVVDRTGLAGAWDVVLECVWRFG